jgi:hypothetical protein
VGSFAEVDWAAGAAPAHGAEPRPRKGNRTEGPGTRWRHCPAIEPGSGTAWVDTGLSAKVLSKVEQYVCECTAHLARCTEGMGVVAMAPNRASPAAGSVDRAGATDRETLDTADEGEGLVRLDDEVKMVLLH